jgi:EAL domain-containing protein (putative c-di-GMP-specific phosphodiesterase class I)
MEGVGALERRLRSALHESSLLLRYQPVVAIATGAVEELRAMLRWPGGGGITPEQLIDIARSAGVLPELHRWILVTACREGAQWRREGVTASVGVTLGADQLRDGTAAVDVALALRSSGLPPGCLSVGLPATPPLAPTETPAAVLDDLSRLGVSIGVVGVRNWPLPPSLRSPAVDWLGLDRQLVALLAELPASRVAVATVVALVGDYGAKTIAAGVETDRELSCVEALGVTHALGYWFAPPTPAVELHALLRRMGGKGLKGNGPFRPGRLWGICT